MRSLKSPVTWLTIIALVIGTLQALWVDMPEAVTIGFAVVLVVVGYLTYGKVTPVNDPRDAFGTHLIPDTPNAQQTDKAGTP